MLSRFALVLIGAFMIMPAPASAQLVDPATETRTAGREVNPDMSQWQKQVFWNRRAKRWSGRHQRADDLAVKHAKGHPARWDDITWEAEKWHGSGWTADRVLDNLFHYGAFDKLEEGGDTPSLHIGAKFFELSDLDQRRSLELLADHTGIFDKGYREFEIYSTPHRRIIGHYNRNGLARY